MPPNLRSEIWRQRQTFVATPEIGMGLSPQPRLAFEHPGVRGQAGDWRKRPSPLACPPLLISGALPGMQAGVGRAGAGPWEMTVEPPGTLSARGVFISVPSGAGGIPRLPPRPWTLHPSRPAGQDQPRGGDGGLPSGFFASRVHAPWGRHAATGLAPASYTARPRPARSQVCL